MTSHDHRNAQARTLSPPVIHDVATTIGLVVALFAIPTHAQEPQAVDDQGSGSPLPVQQPQIHTPARGTPERTAIMDALRREYPRPVIFIVHSLKILDGWAWTSVTAQTPDGREQWESGSALLRERHYGQTWSVLDTQDHSGECATTENCFEAERREIQQRWSDAPKVIFEE